MSATLSLTISTTEHGSTVPFEERWDVEEYVTPDTTLELDQLYDAFLASTSMSVHRQPQPKEYDRFEVSYPDLIAAIKRVGLSGPQRVLVELLEKIGDNDADAWHGEVFQLVWE